MNGMVYIRGHKSDFDAWAKEVSEAPLCLPDFPRSPVARAQERPSNHRKKEIIIINGFTRSLEEPLLAQYFR